MSLIANDLVKFEEYEVHRARWQLSWRDEPLQLNRKTFDLLLYLIDHRERVVGKDELLQALWPDQFIEESNLTQHIFLLRKTLSRHGSGTKIIETVPGRGYRFAVAVSTVEAEPKPTEDRLIFSASETIARITLEEEVETSDPTPLEPAIKQPRLTPPFRSRRTYWITGGAVATAALCVTVWFGWQRWPDHTSGPPVQLVITAMEGTTGDAVLDRALTQALRMDLGQSPYLSVVPTSTVQTTLTQMRHKPDEVMTPAIAREVCERTNSQSVLSGNVAKIGQHFLITEEASSCVDGMVLGQAKYEAASAEDLPHIIDKVAATLRRKLGESRHSISRFGMPLFHDNTPSLEALKAFTLGTQLIREGRIPESIALLKEAVAADPQFASAHYNLAAAYGTAGDDLHLRESIAKAYSLRDTAMKPAQFAITTMYASEYTGDMYELVRSFQSWVDLYLERSSQRPTRSRHELGGTDQQPPNHRAFTAQSGHACQPVHGSAAKRGYQSSSRHLRARHSRQSGRRWNPGTLSSCGLSPQGRSASARATGLVCGASSGHAGAGERDGDCHGGRAFPGCTSAYRQNA
jgi:DNA-binding winged helix-turn-helix (wHTH) protein/TolB-like protein